MSKISSFWAASAIGTVCLAVSFPFTATLPANAQGIPVTVSSSVPNELNPPFNPGPPATGGAPNATPAQAAAFAWQEFIALNWPAGPQNGQPGQRDTPSATVKFGDQAYKGPLVWQTFRSKVEIFPGQGNPPGYSPNSAISYGYDALPPPQYVYQNAVVACGTTRSGMGPTPWINLDETDQISLNSMYAGVVTARPSPTNSAPQIIRFLAKANRMQYVYAAGNQWWSGLPSVVVTDTLNYLGAHKASPPAGGSNLVSVPYGTIEIKAGWRVLNPSEVASGRFHMTSARYYEESRPGSKTPCYRDGTFGLVALHIIQKTPSAPYFIYATFEQADNILTPAGVSLEDVDGTITQPLPATATTPQVCLVDPQPSSAAPATAPPGQQAQNANPLVMLTPDPTTCQPLTSGIPLAQQYCNDPRQQIYYRNATAKPGKPQRLPALGAICVNKRDQEIPPDVIAANRAAHAAIASYLQQNGIRSTPWLYYKLINVQYYPFDKVPTTAPNGSPYTAQPPYTAQNPAPSTFYQANILVETNRALQMFSGSLAGFGGSGANFEWDANPSPHGGLGVPHYNVYYGGSQYNMGGCMGCHGSQGQHVAGDFSVILAAGRVLKPEYPAQPTTKGESDVPRNRLQNLLTLP